MSDLRLVWHPWGGSADINLIGPVLETGDDLATAVIVSLFSDRLAEPEDPLPPNQPDRRGWWGDSYLPDVGDRVGSRLWLLERAVSTDKLPLTARGYILEALQWMLDDGVAGRVEANCFFLGGDQEKLGAEVTITRPKASPLTMRFDWTWRQRAN